MFGCLLITYLLVLIACVEISIVMVYLQLIQEHHYWWWRSFFYAGCSALFVFLYSIGYLMIELDITGTINTIMFLGEMLIICFSLFIITGTTGHIACRAFVWKIYSDLKVD
jgi:transmembrane 9 superfamily protein 2/4